MKKLVVIFTLLIFLLSASVVYANNFSISPARVSLNLQSNSESTLKFNISGFTGDLDIMVENLPFDYEPKSIYLTGNDSVKIVFKGNDEVCCSKTYDGKILFLAKTGDKINYGIKIPATIHYMVVNIVATDSETYESSEQVVIEDKQNNWLFIIIASIASLGLLGYAIYQTFLL